MFEPSLWKSDEGKYISLDHQVALGSDATGVSLNDYLSSLSTSVSITSPEAFDEVLVGENFTVNFSKTQAAGVNAYIDGVFAGRETETNSITLTAPLVEGAFELTLVAIDENDQELDVSTSLTLDAVYSFTLEPEITITSPADGTQLYTNEDFTLTVELDDAAAFEYQFNGVSDVVTGSSEATLTAPAVAADYSLIVTAIDDNGAYLDASDNISLAIVNAPVTSLSCSFSDENVWNSGFVLSVEVTNEGTEAINSWSVSLDLGQMSFANGWSANFSENGSILRATNAAHNGSLAVGDSVIFGFQGAFSGSYSSPSCQGN